MPLAARQHAAYLRSRDIRTPLQEVHDAIRNHCTRRHDRIRVRSRAGDRRISTRVRARGRRGSHEVRNRAAGLREWRAFSDNGGRPLGDADGHRPDPAKHRETMYYLSIVCARESIYIANPYFVPDPVAIETLIDAKNRGVDVHRGVGHPE
jgi:phosphatidylserine/phosphatidylglycerophosphate/cardiolipin synthase-like enzyme